MKESILLFPDSKIKKFNLHDNEELLSERKRSVFEKDAEKQRETDAIERKKRHTASKMDNGVARPKEKRSYKL